MAIETSPELPAKRKRGRPRNQTREELLTILEEQRKQLAELQGAQHNRQQATLSPVPAPTEELRPGTYVEVGRDSSGGAMLAKVGWDRGSIERTYIPVTFTPRRTMTVGPHGISYQLTADIEATVPCIVKDIYDGVFKEEARLATVTRPLSATESSAIDERAMEHPGSQQWSRLYRLAGGGLNVAAPDAQGVTPYGTKGNAGA